MEDLSASLRRLLALPTMSATNYVGLWTHPDVICCNFHSLPLNTQTTPRRVNLGFAVNKDQQAILEADYPNSSEFIVCCCVAISGEEWERSPIPWRFCSGGKD